MTTHRIAVIPGDGIGTEAVPEGLRVLEAAARCFDIGLAFEHFDFVSCDYYLVHGRMLPDDWFDTLSRFDAIYFGAVGWPEKVPDHISLRGSLLQFRRAFDQYVNLRPCRLMPGVRSPLADRRPGDIDFFVVRENTEGEYSSVGGRMFEGTEREIAIPETINRRGAGRLARGQDGNAHLAGHRHGSSRRRWCRSGCTFARIIADLHHTRMTRWQTTSSATTATILACAKPNGSSFRPRPCTTRRSAARDWPRRCANWVSAPRAARRSSPPN
jgi:hypothetical protein